MKTQKKLSTVIFCLAGFFFILWIFTMIVRGDNKVAFFFSMAMIHVFGWSGYTLNITSRKIEELHAEMEELKRKFNETGLAS